MKYESPVENVPFQKIANELEIMFKADQEMRSRWEINDYSDGDLDSVHTDRMREIVEEIGWPTISKVGRNAAYNAWLLVQHADHDVAFQEYCLELMKSEPESEIEPINIAYLEDRVRVNQGREQLYGTQFRQVDGRHVLATPLEEPDEVETRRSAMGMSTLQEQIEKMYKRYPFDNP